MNVIDSFSSTDRIRAVPVVEASPLVRARIVCNTMKHHATAETQEVMTGGTLDEDLSGVSNNLVAMRTIWFQIDVLEE